MAVRFAGCGNGTRLHVRPSVETSTTPDAPTTHTAFGEGAAPALSGVVTPVVVISHVAPPSVERSTLLPARRQRICELGETMSIDAEARFWRRSAPPAPPRPAPPLPPLPPAIPPLALTAPAWACGAGAAAAVAGS